MVKMGWKATSTTKSAVFDKIPTSYENRTGLGFVTENNNKLEKEVGVVNVPFFPEIEILIPIILQFEEMLGQMSATSITKMPNQKAKTRSSTLCKNVTITTSLTPLPSVTNTSVKLDSKSQWNEVCETKNNLNSEPANKLKINLMSKSPMLLKNKPNVFE